VAVFEAAKGVIVLALGCGVLDLIHKNLGDVAERVAEVLNVNPGGMLSNLSYETNKSCDGSHPVGTGIRGAGLCPCAGDSVVENVFLQATHVNSYSGMRPLKIREYAGLDRLSTDQICGQSCRFHFSK
jgi:hypothetical protein